MKRALTGNNCDAIKSQFIYWRAKGSDEWANQARVQWQHWREGRFDGAFIAALYSNPQLAQVARLDRSQRHRLIENRLFDARFWSMSWPLSATFSLRRATQCLLACRRGKEWNNYYNDKCNNNNKAIKHRVCAFCLTGQNLHLRTEDIY